MAIPIIMISCGGSQNRNNAKTSDANVSEAQNGAMNKDSADKSAVLMNDDTNMDHAGQSNVQDFLKEVSSGGLMEVELGKYAQQHATNARIKNYGAMMVNDHSKVNDELKNIASKKNVTLPTTIEDKHSKMMSDIQKKTGVDFDKAYIKAMLDDHEKDVDKFKKQAENSADPDLKDFASKTLPILEMHQDSAKHITAALKY